MEHHDITVKNGNVAMTWIVRVALGLLGTILVAHAWWMTFEVLDLRDIKTTNTAEIRSLQLRMDGLENGRTTPMAQPTRAEFDSVWRTIEDIKARLRMP